MGWLWNDNLTKYFILTLDEPSFGWGRKSKMAKRERVELGWRLIERITWNEEKMMQSRCDVPNPDYIHTWIIITGTNLRREKYHWYANLMKCGGSKVAYNTMDQGKILWSLRAGTHQNLRWILQLIRHHLITFCCEGIGGSDYKKSQVAVASESKYERSVEVGRESAKQSQSVADQEWGSQNIETVKEQKI